MNELREIALDLIDRNPDQPRTVFDEVTLAELAESIKAHGVIQPVEVEETAYGSFMLHHGERRVRAARMAGLTAIPAVVVGARNAEELLVRGILENLHREDLNPIDEARAYRRLVEMGWTRTRISRELGRSQMLITGRLAWLELEPEVQQLVALGHLPLDGRLAMKLRVLPPEARVALAEKLAARAMSLNGCLKAVDAAVEKLAAPPVKEQYHQDAHPVPMIRHGAPGIPANANGIAPVPGRSIRDAAEAMCRSCDLRPKGDVVPSWAIVRETAAATCAECVKRDGPALPDICRRCPGVAMVRAMVEQVKVTEVAR